MTTSQGNFPPASGPSNPANPYAWSNGDAGGSADGWPADGPDAHSGTKAHIEGELAGHFHHAGQAYGDPAYGAQATGAPGDPTYAYGAQEPLPAGYAPAGDYQGWDYAAGGADPNDSAQLGAQPPAAVDPNAEGYTQPAPVEVDLLPPGQRDLLSLQRARKSALTILAIALALVLAATLLTLWQRHQAQRALNLANEQMAASQKAVDDLASVPTTLARVDGLAKAIEGGLGGEVLMSELVPTITNTLPPGTALSNLTINLAVPEDPALLNQPNADVGDLIMQGSVPNAQTGTALLQALGALPQLSNASITSENLVGQQYNFSLSADLTQQALSQRFTRDFAAQMGEPAPTTPSVPTPQAPIPNPVPTVPAPAVPTPAPTQPLTPEPIPTAETPAPVTPSPLESLPPDLEPTPPPAATVEPAPTLNPLPTAEPTLDLTPGATDLPTQPDLTPLPLPTGESALPEDLPFDILPTDESDLQP